MSPRPTAAPSFEVAQGTGCDPAVLARLMALFRQSPPNPDAIERTLGLDPVLCLQLLPEAVAQGGPLTVRQLLAQCGVETLQALVLRAAWRQSREHPATPCAEAIRLRLRKAALFARSLARASTLADPEAASLAGLLVFSGQLLMALHGGGDYAQLVDGSGPDRREQLRRESARFGVNHVELGLSLLASSGLPPSALDALRYHDLPSPQLDYAHPLTRLLLLADRLAANGIDTDTAALAARWLGLNAAALAPLSAEVEQALATQQHDLPRSVDPLREAFTLPQSFPAASTAAAPTVWQRLRAALEVQHGLRPLLMFTLDTSGEWLTAVVSPKAEGMRLPRQPGLSLLAEASLASAPRDSFQSGPVPTSVVDEQLARALGQPGLFCLPFRAGVVVIGVDRDGQRRCREQAALLQPLLNAAAEALLVRTPVPPLGHEDADRRLREARHELAAPLTTLGNYLHLIRDKAPAASEELRILHEELGRLRAIVNRLGSSQPQPEAHRTDLNRLMRDVAAAEGSGHAQRQVAVEVSTDPRLPPLQTDPVMLRQILGNLVRNACEALPPGGRVRMETLLQEGRSGEYVTCLRVSDNGPGIPAPLFERLYEPKPYPQAGHEGLGLVIVKQLADALGARLDCQSDARQGTRFELQLPAGRSAPAYLE